MGRRGGGGGDLLTSKVLRDIRAYYREALELLPVEEFPSLLTAGASFGLLDPVSNIIVNTTTAGMQDTTPPSSSRKNKRKRSQPMMEGDKEEVLAQISRGIAERSLDGLKEKVKEQVLVLVSRGIAKRSLDGLLTFLVRRFRYLQTHEALRYLRRARADLVVAVRLIELDRHVTSSNTTDPSSTSFKVALKCAAISAKHHCPATLAAIWLSLATDSPTDCQKQLRQLSSHPPMQELLLARPKPAGLGHFHNLHQHKSLRKYTKQKTRDSVAATLPELDVCVLLDMLHPLYLKAIARFPRDALRVSHHRGLLKAGCCFGPMDDPVSNIVFNTIWCDTVFPPEEEFLVDMILTKSLARTQARSASGLLRSICTYFSDLSWNDAVAFLLQADGNLHEAICKAQRQGHEASGSLKEAYRMAAIAAWHPNPEALAEFAVSNVQLSPSVLSLLKISDRSLTAEEVETISASMEAVLGSSSSSRQSMIQVPELSTKAAEVVARFKDNFGDDQFYFRGIAEAALKSMGPRYQLYVICGVNEKVAETRKRGYYELKDGHPYCHINFLARPRGSPSAAPLLFFAECSNDYVNTEVPRCCVVDPSTDDGRCYDCEEQGTKIVHPSYGRYRGCDTEFEDMARGKDLTCTNDELVSCGCRRTNVAWIPGEDSVYFDPRWDTKMAERINKGC